MIRLLGALLLCCGCTGAGVSYWAGLQRRRQALRRLSEQLRCMEREITQLSTPLPALLRELSEDNELFRQPIRSTGEEADFSARWAAMTEALDADAELRRSMLGLGLTLSRGGNTETAFAAIRTETEHALSALEELLRDKGRLAPGVSFCVGALLALALL